MVEKKETKISRSQFMLPGNFCWVIRLLYLLQLDHLYFISNKFSSVSLPTKHTWEKCLKINLYCFTGFMHFIFKETTIRIFPMKKRTPFKLPQMSKVPGYANTYVIVLETPRTRIDLQHKAWLTEYFYAHTLPKMHSSWFFFFFQRGKKRKRQIMVHQIQKFFLQFFWKVLPLHDSMRRCCRFH